MAKIPREVWRFCVDQIKNYPLTEIAYDNARADIKAQFENSGMSGPPDPSGVHVHSGQSPQEVKYIQREKAMNNPHYRYLARSVAVMEIAKRGQDKKIIDAIWTEGWRDNSLIAIKADCSVASVKRAKHEMIKRIATGWGLW